MKTDPLPISFRTSEVDRILNALQAGDSCAVVGIGSVGKSNLLRFLQQEEVRRAKLGQEWGKYLFIYIDVNKLIEQSPWGLWELMLHQLRIKLSQRGVEEATHQAIHDWHRSVMEPVTQHLALRYLDFAMAITCDRLELSLVFLLDDFDDLCRTLPPQAFTFLRALRDDHKYRLMYVVATRKELHRLRENSTDIEAFEELVTPNTIWLTSYSEADARHMLRRLAARYEVDLDEKSIHEVLAATGGHPGLLRAGFQIACEHPVDMIGALVADRRIQDECQRIWRSIAEDEQQVIADLANRGYKAHHPIGETMKRLRVKGLIGGGWAEADEIFSSLLAEYVRREKPVIGAHIYVDRGKRTVLVDDRKVENLAPLEYKLIEFLDRQRGEVCSRDDIALCLYPDDMAAEGKGVTDNRIDSVVKRLRKQIEPNPDEPRFIVTVRGHGLQLEDGESYKK